MILIEVKILKEIFVFCDSTHRPLYKWSKYTWKLVCCANNLQILMSSFDIVSGARDVVTWEHSNNIKISLKNFLVGTASPHYTTALPPQYANWDFLFVYN